MPDFHIKLEGNRAYAIGVFRAGYRVASSSGQDKILVDLVQGCALGGKFRARLSGCQAVRLSCRAGKDGEQPVRQGKLELAKGGACGEVVDQAQDGMGFLSKIVWNDGSRDKLRR